MWFIVSRDMVKLLQRAGSCSTKSLMTSEGDGHIQHFIHPVEMKVFDPTKSLGY